MKAQPVSRSIEYPSGCSTPEKSPRPEQNQRVQFLWNQIEMAIENNSIQDAQIARNIYKALQPTDELPEHVHAFFQSHLKSEPGVLFAGLQGLQIPKKSPVARTLFQG